MDLTLDAESSLPLDECLVATLTLTAGTDGGRTSAPAEPHRGRRQRGRHRPGQVHFTMRLAMADRRHAALRRPRTGSAPHRDRAPRRDRHQRPAVPEPRPVPRDRHLRRGRRPHAHRSRRSRSDARSPATAPARSALSERDVLQSLLSASLLGDALHHLEALATATTVTTRALAALAIDRLDQLVDTLDTGDADTMDELVRAVVAVLPASYSDDPRRAVIATNVAGDVRRAMLDAHPDLTGVVTAERPSAASVDLALAALPERARRSFLRTLPLGLRGSASTQSTLVGHLKRARCSRA